MTSAACRVWVGESAAWTSTRGALAMHIGGVDLWKYGVFLQVLERRSPTRPNKRKQPPPLPHAGSELQVVATPSSVRADELDSAPQMRQQMQQAVHAQGACSWSMCCRPDSPEEASLSAKPPLLCTQHVRCSSSRSKLP